MTVQKFIFQLLHLQTKTEIWYQEKWTSPIAVSMMLLIFSLAAYPWIMIQVVHDMHSALREWLILMDIPRENRYLLSKERVFQWKRPQPMMVRIITFINLILLIKNGPV